MSNQSIDKFARMDEMSPTGLLGGGIIRGAGQDTRTADLDLTGGMNPANLRGSSNIYQSPSRRFYQT